MEHYFKYPIFVKTTDESFAKALEDLGYTCNNQYVDGCDCIMTSGVTGHYMYMHSDMFYETYPHHTWNCAGRINCENNKDLALALAAINDQNDYMQWFTAGNNCMLLCCNDTKNSFEEYHKATKEELIKHFTKNNETTK